MNLEMAIAGLVSVAMGVGHTVVGRLFVLPHVNDERFPGSSLGPASMTVAMMRVTWYIVTIFAFGMGGILLTLTWTDADPLRVALGWLAATWFAATLMAIVVVPIRPSTLRLVGRLPVPVLWVVVGALCTAAAAAA